MEVPGSVERIGCELRHIDVIRRELRIIKLLRRRDDAMRVDVRTIVLIVDIITFYRTSDSGISDNRGCLCTGCIVIVVDYGFVIITRIRFVL